MMKSEDIENLLDILVPLADDDGKYFKVLAERAGLPEEWIQEIFWKQPPRAVARELIKTVLARGSQDNRFFTLGGILHIVLNEEVGPDKGVHIAVLIVRYNLYRDKGLLKKLKEDQNLIEQLAEQYQVQDFDGFDNTVLGGNTLVSEQSKNGLLEILQTIEESDLDSIKDACRKALPKPESHRALSITKSEGALDLLNKYPLTRDGVPRVLLLAFYLLNDNYIEQIHRDIKAWFETNEFDIPIVSLQDSPLGIEPRLLVVVEEVLLTRGDQRRFSVKSWFVPNLPFNVADKTVVEEIYKSEEYYLLDLSYLLAFYSEEFSEYSDKISKYISISLFRKIKEIEIDGAMCINNLNLSLQELKELLNLLFSEATLIMQEYKNHDQFDVKELVIELFLPEVLLCSIDVDKWSVVDINIDIDSEEEEQCLPIGAQFKVLLHNLARFKKRQAQLNRKEAKRAKLKNDLQDNPWKTNWKLVLEKLKTSLTSEEFLMINADSDLNQAFLQLKLKKRAGVVLGQTHKRDEVLNSIITKAGVPIVLWTRYEGSDIDHSSEMHELICATPLINLPERVLSKRQEAVFANQESHLGHHLTVLWDDPNRFPPTDGYLETPA